MRSHYQRVHLNFRINCEFCTSIFSRKDFYRKHVLASHSDIDEGSLEDLLDRINAIKMPKIPENC